MQNSGANIRRHCVSPEYPNSNFPGRAPVENGQAYPTQGSTSHCHLWRSAHGPTPPSSASAQNGSYLGISCRQYRCGITAEDDPGCVKTLHGITAPRILRLVVALRENNAKIRPSLGITTKSDFVFAQPRPIGDIGRRQPVCDRFTP